MNLPAKLRREEGSRPHAYQDHLGFWTIGVGRLIDVRKGGGLSPERAMRMSKQMQTGGWTT